MMEFKVLYTAQAERDLRAIFEYISYTLVALETARKQTQRIIESISKLNNMPMRYALYEKEPWHSKGLRVMPVDNYLVFYITDEAKNTVVIIRIMYGGRDIDKQLNNDLH